MLGSENKSPDAITSYRSPTTSLRGLVVKTDEPICSLHIILATESGNPTSSSWHHPDDGLPHCLEHLVFLGSLSYPHKGVLDKLANRCMADGTNAWTATDHTAYTLSTAGSEGVMNLLPIYADHILFPTLTDSGFLTEIHYVNGKGEDKGVVYCEMQVSSNQSIFVFMFYLAIRMKIIWCRCYYILFAHIAMYGYSLSLSLIIQTLSCCPSSLFENDTHI
jgi:hypothetical protein